MPRADRRRLAAGLGRARARPAVLAATLPRVKLTVTVITLNEAAQHRGGAGVGRLGRRDHRRRLGQHRRHGRRSRGGYATRVESPRLAGLRRAEEPRGVARLARLDSVARRRRARHAGAGRRDPRRPRGEPRAARLPHSARDLVPRALDPQHRLVSRLPAAALRSPRGRWNGRRVHESVELHGTRRPAARTSSSTTPTATSRITSRRSIATRRSPREQMAGRRPAHQRRSRSSSIRRSRSCATTSLRGGFRDGAAGLLVSALNSYYVFLKFAKLWELQQRAPSTRSRPTNRSRPIRRDLDASARSGADVLPPHRHGAHLARRAEPGAADGAWACARSATGRRSSRIPSGELRQRAQEGST